MSAREDLAHGLERRFPWLYARVLRRFEGRLTTVVPLLGALVLSVLCMWGFLALADAFPERGALTRLDIAVDKWVQAHNTEGGEVAFSVVSAFGSPVLYAMDVAAAAFFASRRAWNRFVIWCVTVAGASLMDWALKLFFHRVRPPGASEFIHTRSWSFPSGHALNSLVAYSLLTFFILEPVADRRIRRVAVFAAAALVTAIGVSRIYLGVHYLSDVLAGYLAGGVWVTAGIVAYQVARRRSRSRASARTAG